MNPSKANARIWPVLATAALGPLLVHRSENPTLFQRWSDGYAALLILYAINVALLWRATLAGASPSTSIPRSSTGRLLVFAAATVAIFAAVNLTLGSRAFALGHYAILLLGMAALIQVLGSKPPDISPWMLRSTTLVLLVILLIGAALRLYGIGFGLPFRYDPDEHMFVNISRSFLVESDFNPHWFGHPGTTCVTLLTGLYGLIFAAGKILGLLPDTTTIRTFFYEHRELVFMTGRMMIAAFGVAAIAFTFFLGRRVFGAGTGLGAALIVALSPLHIAYSKLIRTDIMAGVLVMAVIWFALDVLEKRTSRASLWAGLFTGLAVATKYPAAIVSLPAGLAHFLAGGRGSRRFWRLVLYGGASLAGVILASPFLFLDFRTAVADLHHEGTPWLLSHAGKGPLRNLIWYLGKALPSTVSASWVIFALIGAGLCLASALRGRWLITTFALVFVVVIACLRVRMNHWDLPVVPVLCVLAAYGLLETGSWIGRKWALGTVWPATILLLGITTPLIYEDVLQGREMSLPDTRTLAGEWMLANIPPGSRVLLEARTPQLPKERFQLMIAEEERLVPMRRVETPRVWSFDEDGMDPVCLPYGTVGSLGGTQALARERVDYVVLSDAADTGSFAEKTRYPGYERLIATYQALTREGTLVYELRPVPGKSRGPTITIYAFGQAAALHGAGPGL